MNMEFMILMVKRAFSLTRILLDVLYWHEYKNSFTNEYNGMAVRDIYNMIENKFNDCKAISDMMLRLSIYGLKMLFRNVTVDWAPLVTITYTNDYNDLYACITDKSCQNISIKLTESGRCYVSYLSLQYEVF